MGAEAVVGQQFHGLYAAQCLDGAGKVFEIHSEAELDVDARSALFWETEYFESSETADCVIQVRRAEPPAACGKLVYENAFFRLFESGEGFLQQTLDRAALERGEKCAMLASRFGGALSESALDVNALNIDNALNIEVFLPQDFPPEQECMQQIWQSINLPFQLLQRGIFTLHSAAVQTRFGAILFCGRSGIGKSTQANLWKEYENALILNGDRCAVGFVDGAANAFGLPFCGTSGICLNFSLPIAAIISLGQAPKNRITRLSGVRALRAIMSNIVGLYGGAMRESHAELFFRAAECIPIFELHCTADFRAVRLLKETLEGGE